MAANLLPAPMLERSVGMPELAKKAPCGESVGSFRSTPTIRQFRAALRLRIRAQNATKRGGHLLAKSRRSAGPARLRRANAQSRCPPTRCARARAERLVTGRERTAIARRRKLGPLISR